MNRPELYKIIDAEKKVTGAAHAVEDTETVGYAGAFNRNRSTKKTQSKSKQSKKTQKPKKKSQSSTSVDRMCRTCTQAAGKPVYHDPPYGGGKNCKYGKSGKPKQSRRLNAVQPNAEGADNNDGEGNESDPYSGSDGDGSDVEGACEEEYLPSFGGGCYGGNI